MNQDCIFCKIIKGEIPSYKTYEDEKFLGFLDINPLTKGNSLLIPKEHHRWVNDVPDFAEYWQAAKKLALATQAVTNAESISYLTLGYEIPHAHIRIIPRFPDDPHHQNGINLKETVNLSSQEMEALSNEIFSKTNS